VARITTRMPITKSRFTRVRPDRALHVGAPVPVVLSDEAPVAMLRRTTTVSRRRHPSPATRAFAAPTRFRPRARVLACDDLPGSLVWRPIEPLLRPVQGLAMVRVVRRHDCGDGHVRSRHQEIW
jgi:hypothetical protein